MENLVNALEVFRGRKVLITGDTGFKGSWLSLWLHQHGAKVFGYALPPEDNSHFGALGLSKIVQHRDGDIRDYKSLSTSINEVDPDIIFHPSSTGARYQVVPRSERNLRYKRCRRNQPSRGCTTSSWPQGPCVYNF